MPRSTVFTSAAVLAFAIAPVAARAQIVTDGTLDAAYGPAIVTQSIGTGFGNATDGNAVTANGSELDGAYAKISGGYLHLFLTGNLESNFNKLDVFIDSVAGGQNRLRNDFVPGTVDFGNPNKMGGDGTSTGLRFDTGFAPDYYLTFALGGTPTTLYGNYAAFTADAPGTGKYMGGSDTLHLVDNAVDSNNPAVGPTHIEAALNNSNTAGVGGTSGAHDDGSGVTTGMELLIPMAAIGKPTAPIRVSAFINNGDHNYLANQVLASLPDNTGNLGGDNVGGFNGTAAAIDFQLFAGDQFFTVSLLPGDANGDGRIDADDYALTDRGFANHLTGWSNGDFNNDNVVDAADYMLLDGSYLQQGGAFDPAFLAARSGAFGPGYVAGLLASVPEPASLLTPIAFALASARRRRGRCG